MSFCFKYHFVKKNVFERGTCSVRLLSRSGVLSFALLHQMARGQSGTRPQTVWEVKEVWSHHGLHKSARDSQRHEPILSIDEVPKHNKPGFPCISVTQ